MPHRSETEPEHGYDGGVITQHGDTIGWEILDPGTHPCGIISDPCRNSDSALFSASTAINLGAIARTTASSGCEDCTDTPLTINHSNPTLPITSRLGYVIEDETLHKIGQNSGWTYGIVEDSCADYEIDGWVRQCSDRVDYSSTPGDSGSPVFSLKGDGTAELRGVHFGRFAFIYNDALMSNLNRIEMDLGSLTVFDPGTPIIGIEGPTEIPQGIQCQWAATVVKGVPPFTYQWSGVLSGSSASIVGAPSSDGWLTLTVTDYLSRQDTEQIFVDVQTGLPPLCQ